MCVAPISHNLPQSPTISHNLPQSHQVHLTGIDLGVGLHYDEPGKWGRGAASGDARTAVTGTIDLTISELSEVTECEGHLSVGETELVGEKAGDRQRWAEVGREMPGVPTLAEIRRGWHRLA